MIPALCVTIHMTDRITGESRSWIDGETYDFDAFGDGGWANYMWSDGNMGHGGNRAIYFVLNGGRGVPDADDDRFHVRIVNQENDNVLYEDGEEFGENT